MNDHPLAFRERPFREEARAVALRVGQQTSTVDARRAPTTSTADISAAGTPRKLICDCGVASRLPGIGETVTAPSSSCELFNVMGVQAGAGGPVQRRRSGRDREEPPASASARAKPSTREEPMSQQSG